VRPDVADLVPLLRVGVQNARQHVLAVGAQKLGQRVLRVHDLFVEVRRLGVLEGEVAAHHRVQHHARAPDVRADAVVLLAGNHFGCGIAGRTTGRLQQLVFLVHVTETEVDNLERLVVVEQQVLRLEVTVAHAARVQVLDARNQLLVELARLLLLQTRVPHDVVEQLAAVGVLHDHEELLLRLDDLVQLDDVVVAHLLQNLYLTSYPLNILLIINLIFLKNLYSYLNTIKV
jgi:hypothetical protein